MADEKTYSVAELVNLIEMAITEHYLPAVHDEIAREMLPSVIFGLIDQRLEHLINTKFRVDAKFQLERI